MIKIQQFPHKKYTQEIYKLHSYMFWQSTATFKEQHLKHVWFKT